MVTTVIEEHSPDLSSLEAQIQAFNGRRACEEQRSTSDTTDWRLVIDTSNDAFLSVDASGVICEWNARAESLFGWSRDEVLGMKLGETIFPESVVKGASGLQQLTRAGREGKRLEVTARRRDGREIPAEVSMSMMQRQGAITFNAFVHDISARRELQAQIAHGQKLESIGQLAAGIAHEINTPTQYVGDNTRFVRDALGDVIDVLAAFQKLAETVRVGADPTQVLADVDQAIEQADLDYLTTELKDAVGQSLEGVERIATIVRAMKEFSHPGAATKTPTNINDAIRATVTVATNEWKYVAKIETDFDESLPLVPCLPGDFNQVILNMIVNAAHAIGEKVGEHTGGKGVIRLETKQCDGMAEIRITDDGAGIPDDVKNRIFDPFFTTKDVGLGTGQGLAISRNVIVDKHDGALDVITQVGVGSTFVVRIPLAQQASPGGLR